MHRVVPLLPSALAVVLWSVLTSGVFDERADRREYFSPAAQLEESLNQTPISLVATQQMVVTADEYVV